MTDPQLIRQSIFNLQVCVPNTYTDEQVVEFAKQKLFPQSFNPTIIEEHSNGDAARVTCSEDKDNVHIVLEY